MSYIPICSICYERYKPTSLLNTTTCGHIYHLDCILQWLEVSLNCPECRRSEPGIFPAFLNFEQSSTEDKSCKSSSGHSNVLSDLTKRLSLKEEEHRKTKKELEEIKQKLQDKMIVIEALLKQRIN